MPIENEHALKQIYQMMHRFSIYFPELIEDNNKAKQIGFEEWNKQFTDNQDLDSFIPEYGTTLGEFRQTIYKAEIDDDEISMEELKESMKNWL